MVPAYRNYQVAECNKLCLRSEQWPQPQVGGTLPDPKEVRTVRWTYDLTAYRDDGGHCGKGTELDIALRCRCSLCEVFVKGEGEERGMRVS